MVWELKSQNQCFFLVFKTKMSVGQNIVWKKNCKLCNQNYSTLGPQQFLVHISTILLKIIFGTNSTLYTVKIHSWSTVEVQKKLYTLLLPQLWQRLNAINTARGRSTLTKIVFLCKWKVVFWAIEKLYF